MELKVPPVALVIVIALLMWGLDHSVPQAAFDFAGRRAVAALLWAAGLAIAVAGVVAFRRLGTTVNPHTPAQASRLAADGVYRITRNPMYLGLACVVVGLALWLGNAAALLGLPLFIIYMNRFQIAPEERALRERFGDEYRAYSARVRRWL